MKIKKLSLRNIRSFENQTIEFPEGAVLLSGDIGSGKTSILLAIEYALFGLQPGQKGSALLRNNSHLGEVILDFEIDGKSIVIERRLKRESKSVSNDYSAITIDGEKTEFSVTELKTRILELLHYPAEFIKRNNLLYKYTIYTPQEQMKQIILEDPEVRLNVLGHIFGIDKYKRIRENLSILVSKLKEDSKILQGEIKTLDQDKTSLDSTKAFTILLAEKIKIKENELKELIDKRKRTEKETQELEKKIKEKENFEKEVEKARILIVSKKENLNLLRKELEVLSKSISEHGEAFSEDKFREAVKKLMAKREEIERLNSKYMGIASEINSLEQIQKVKTDKKNRIFKIDICPTCLQDVPSSHKHNILNETEKELVETANKISSLEKEKTEIRTLLDHGKSELQKLEGEKVNLEILKSKQGYIEKSRSRAAEIHKINENLEKDITLLSSHLEKLKESILEFSKFKNLFALKQGELNNAFLEEKKSEISLAELKKELELTNKEITNFERIISGKEASRKKLAGLLELSDWLSNQFTNLVNFMERNVMIKLRMEFAALFGKWFAMLAGEGFEVQLDENFTPLIIQGENEMEYSFLSGGERTAVALAYRLALNQTINSVLSNIKTKDLIILDEPTEGFSELQLEKLRDVLHELDVEQLIIVSHEQKTEGFVDNIIRLKKEGHVSFLENSNASPL